MYIGLVDNDMLVKRWHYPNLELMKLSSFHKKNRDIVELVSDYRECDKYSKVYLRKDTIIKPVPTMFLSRYRDKCEYGGLAFTKGIYIPMEQEIENCTPDVSIYGRIRNKDLILNTFLNKELIRLQTSNNFYCDNKAVLVYDKQPHKFDNFTKLYEQAKTIECVYPIEDDDFDRLVEIASLEKLLRKNMLLYSPIVTSVNQVSATERPYHNFIYINLFKENELLYNKSLTLALINSKRDLIKAIHRKNPNIKFYMPDNANPIIKGYFSFLNNTETGFNEKYLISSFPEVNRYPDLLYLARTIKEDFKCLVKIKKEQK